MATEHFDVIDESNHKWRIELPNIIDDMDLDPYEVRLYLKFKRIAGDAGYCNRSNARLAKETKMGLTKLKECKARLAQPFPELGGKPLIRITPRKNEDGGAKSDLITIVDIWPENFEIFLNQKKARQSEVKKDLGVVATQPGVVVSQPGGGREANRGGSPNDYKEEQSKKTYMKKDNVGTMPSSASNFLKSLSKEQRAVHDKIVKWIPQWGEPVRSEDVCAWFLAKEFTIKQVADAFAVYRQDCEEYRDRKESINDMGAYMRGALNEGRAPKNVDEEFNRQHAEKAAVQHRWLEVTKRYVKIAVLDTEIYFNQARNTFIRHFDEKVANAKLLMG